MEKDNRIKEILKARVDDFWDMILLNILFVLSCLPLFTIGAATSALTLSVSKISEKRKQSCFSSYIEAFKSKFGAALRFWIVMLCCIAAVFVDFAIVSKFDGMAKYAALGLTGFVSIIIWCTNVVGLYSISISETRIPVIKLIKLGMLVIAMHPLCVIGSSLVAAVPFLVALLLPNLFADLFIVWVTVYFSFTQLLVVKLFSMFGLRKLIEELLQE